MTASLVDISLVAIGSATGGVARFLVTDIVTGRVGEAFPWGTLAVNVSGSFVIGLLAAILAGQPQATASVLAHLLIIGVLGGYTTASAFSLQTLTLITTGRPGHAIAYVASSLLICVAAAWLGYAVVAGFAA